LLTKCLTLFIVEVLILIFVIQTLILMRCEINLYQQDQLYTLAIENVFRSKMSGIVL